MDHIHGKRGLTWVWLHVKMQQESRPYCVSTSTARSTIHCAMYCTISTSC